MGELTAMSRVELRGIEEDKRLATMLVCRYGETSFRTPQAGAAGERFVGGAFTRSVETRGDRIPFTDAHTDGTGVFKRPPVARPVSWEANPDDVWAVLRFFDTPEGWRAFLRAKDGELDAASIGFMPVEERVGADGAREHVEAELHHVCLLATADGAVPSYDAPRILETRRAALPDVSALLAVTYDVALAEDCVDPAVLARMADRG